MILRCDGRRRSAPTATALLEALALDSLARTLAADGYQMQPFRAPRGLRNGQVTIRVTWTRRTADECQVVRITHTVRAVIA